MSATEAALPARLPYQPSAAALVKQRTEDNSKDDPHGSMRGSIMSAAAVRPLGTTSSCA